MPKSVLYKIWMTAFVFTIIFLGVIMRVGGMM